MTQKTEKILSEVLFVINALSLNIYKREFQHFYIFTHSQSSIFVLRTPLHTSLISDVNTETCRI